MSSSEGLSGHFTFILSCGPLYTGKERDGLFVKKEETLAGKKKWQKKKKK
jgi:hypothetical protein